jgi:hypothetical protein
MVGYWIPGYLTYVPDLKYCFLLPQHWAQTAPESIQGTRMETGAECIILIWGQGQHRRTVSHSRDTNIPVFWAAPATSTYKAFVACVKAMESQFCRQEHVLQLLGHCHLMHNKEDKFLAKENILLTDSYRNNDTLVSEGAGPNNETIQASNLSQATSDEDSGVNEATQVGPLTFNPTPQLEDDEQHQHVAIDHQAELMQWHHRLGHLLFSKLKKLAIIGKIPKRLAKVKPPVCAGCLFSTMTTVPWGGEEGESDHKVFVVTKPGKIVSVYQMISTQVGFIPQLKGGLTKKQYTAAMVFMDHYSRLQYIHLMTHLTLQETVDAKRAFKHFAEQHGVQILHYHCNNG